jgi:hypothetical protein
MIELALVAELTVTVGDAVEVGATPAGLRRVVPITGGEARGPRLRGRVLPGGADVQLIRPDGVAELVARYVIETPTGSRVFIENRGLRHGPADAMERLRRGEAVDPGLIYFRTTPRFETGDDSLAWLTRHVFVATAIRRPDRVELAIYQVL